MSVPYPYAHPSAQEGPSSPRRRQHAVQPPNLLTTSLGNARNISLGFGGIIQTPLSTTSLSSPFSTNQPLPYAASPGGAMRGISPMATRTPATYNTPYNPQQWGSANPPSSSTSAALGSRHRQATRVEALASRPVGPDGTLELLLPSGSFLTLNLQSPLPLHHRPIHLGETTKAETPHAVSMPSHRLKQYRPTQIPLATIHRSARPPQYLPISILGISALHLHRLRNSHSQMTLQISTQHQLSPLRLPSTVLVIVSVQHPSIMQTDSCLP